MVDTSVLISAFAFDGIPEKVIKKVFSTAEIYVTTALLKEYREVPLRLEAEGKINHVQLEALISGIAGFVSRAQLIFTKKSFRLCRDPADDILLECCHSAKADFLISGDKDLLELENLPFKLEILNPRQFNELG